MKLSQLAGLSLMATHSVITYAKESTDYAICEQHRLLFQDAKPARDAIKLWQRLLPRYIKTQMDKYNSDNPILKKSETELPINHTRFNVLGN